MPAAIPKPGGIQAATKTKHGPQPNRAQRSDLSRSNQAEIVTHAGVKAGTSAPRVNPCIIVGRDAFWSQRHGTAA